MALGMINDMADVLDLQSFLNVEMGAGLPLTGVFGPMTDAAVKAFQEKYWDEVLAPWATLGLGDDHVGTGFVYKTTQWKVNMIHCPSLNLPFPELP